MFKYKLGTKVIDPLTKQEGQIVGRMKFLETYSSNHREYMLEFLKAEGGKCHGWNYEEETKKRVLLYELNNSFAPRLFDKQ